MQLLIDERWLNMSYQATVYRIFIASPKDVVKEREAIPKVIYSWNATNSLYYKVILEPVKWETHATPEMDDKGAQEIINKQLVRKCDILIGVFRMRIGTPTSEAESGTLEEIEEFQKAGKPIMLYFFSRAQTPESKEIDQYNRLLHFKGKIKGLVYSYKSLEELLERIQSHITQTIQDIHKPSINGLEEAEGSERETWHKIQLGVKVAVPSLSRVVPSSGGGKVSLKPRVYDEKTLLPIGSARLPSYRWDARNCEGFWYDQRTGNTSEVLEIGGPLGNPLITTIDHDDRTIPKKTLVYQTVKQQIRYKANEANALNTIECAYNEYDEKVYSGGFYCKLGLFGESYIAVNGKAKKLSKHILEQGTFDTKMLAVGETWHMGDGYDLTAQSIDSKAIPKQVWLVLSKDGIKLDDKVIAQGEVYTYVEKNIADEKDVPLFVTYIDSVFDSNTSDIVQLKYTWLISHNVFEVEGGDEFGIFRIRDAGDDSLTFWNEDSSVDLPMATIVDLAGNIKFKAAEDPNYLRFYPMFLYK